MISLFDHNLQDEKPYKCYVEGCSYSVVQKSNLIHHYEKCHPGIPCPVAAKSQNMSHLSGFNNVYTLPPLQSTSPSFSSVLPAVTMSEVIATPHTGIIASVDAVSGVIATEELESNSYEDTDV